MEDISSREDEISSMEAAWVEAHLPGTGCHRDLVGAGQDRIRTLARTFDILSIRAVRKLVNTTVSGRKIKMQAREMKERTLTTCHVLALAISLDCKEAMAAMHFVSE